MTEEALFLSDRTYVLAARPGRVSRELEVSFSRPREYALLGREDFARLKSELLTILHEQTPGGQRVSSS